MALQYSPKVCVITVRHYKARVDSCCIDLDLELHPDKCVTFSYNGREMVQDAKIIVSKGSTRNITLGARSYRENQEASV